MTQDELDLLASEIGNAMSICHKEVLTFDEAAKYMGVKKSSLYKLTSSKVIPHFKPNGKVIFFKREALEQWMMSNPVATTADLNDKAQAYCLKSKRTTRI